jgi:hypothetical protein
MTVLPRSVLSRAFSQAAFLARTYLPSHMPRLVELWKKDLARINARVAESLADPTSYPNLFPELEWALKAEEVLTANRRRPIPAAAYLQATAVLEVNPIEAVKAMAAAVRTPLPRTSCASCRAACVYVCACACVSVSVSVSVHAPVPMRSYRYACARARVCVCVSVCLCVCRNASRGVEVSCCSIAHRALVVV